MQASPYVCLSGTLALLTMPIGGSWICQAPVPVSRPPQYTVAFDMLLPSLSARPSARKAAGGPEKLLDHTQNRNLIELSLTSAWLLGLPSLVPVLGNMAVALYGFRSPFTVSLTGCVCTCSLEHAKCFFKRLDMQGTLGLRLGEA